MVYLFISAIVPLAIPVRIVRLIPARHAVRIHASMAENVQKTTEATMSAYVQLSTQEPTVKLK